LQLIQDPEFRDIVPPLMDEEYSQLEKNIMEDGIREPLVIWNGIIIDGNNRFKICAEHGIHFETVEKDLPDRQAAIEWIILNQFGRRNLSPGNRSILALKLEPIFREKARANMIATQNNKAGAATLKSAEQVETRKEIARIAGVGHDTIDKVKRIIDLGTPEQVERIKKGDKGNTVNAIYREIKRKPLAEPTMPKFKQEPPKADNSFKAIVADLKNMDKDTSYTPQMVIEEYTAFAKRIIRDFKWYEQEYFIVVYPKMATEEHEKITALNTAMLKTVKEINEIQKG